MRAQSSPANSDLSRPPSTFGGGSSKMEETIERILAMMHQERDGYDYARYLPPAPQLQSSPSWPTQQDSEEPQTPRGKKRSYPPSSCVTDSPGASVGGDADEAECEDDDAIRPLNASWREKICQWSYNVVDHFDLPRELVAVSLDLFDRHLATRNNRCSGNQALLVSLTTLHIAIKLHSDRRLKITTLASLSRGQFGPDDIEKMEWSIFQSLGWKLHPPTMFSFLSHYLLLLPPSATHAVRKDLFERTIYIIELSVCDSYFVTLPTSVVSFAALLNVIEEVPYYALGNGGREYFLNELYHRLGLHCHDPYVLAARRRLLAMFSPAEPSDQGIPTSPTGVVVHDDQLIEMDMSNEVTTAHQYSFENVNNTDIVGTNYYPQIDASDSFGAISSPNDVTGGSKNTARSGLSYVSSTRTGHLVTSPISTCRQEQPSNVSDTY